MSNLLQAKLPEYVVDIIKLYTGEGHWRNGKYMNQISKNDPRFEMLKNRSTIKQIQYSACTPTKSGCAWFKVNGKFMVISVADKTIWNGSKHISGYFWEIYYNKENSKVYLY